MNTMSSQESDPNRTEQAEPESNNKQTGTATAEGPSWSEVVKPYENAAHTVEGVAHSMVEYGLNVAEDSVANAGELLRGISATMGVKVAEASLNGAGDVLSEVSKSIGRIRESLVGRTTR